MNRKTYVTTKVVQQSTMPLYTQTTATSNAHSFYTASSNYTYQMPATNTYIINTQTQNYPTKKIIYQNTQPLTYVQNPTILQPKITYVNSAYYVTNPNQIQQNQIYTTTLQTQKNINTNQNYSINDFKNYFNSENTYGDSGDYFELTYDPRKKQQLMQSTDIESEQLSSSYRTQDSGGQIQQNNQNNYQMNMTQRVTTPNRNNIYYENYYVDNSNLTDRNYNIGIKDKGLVNSNSMGNLYDNINKVNNMNNVNNNNSYTKNQNTGAKITANLTSNIAKNNAKKANQRTGNNLNMNVNNTNVNNTINYRVNVNNNQNQQKIVQNMQTQQNNEYIVNNNYMYGAPNNQQKKYINSNMNANVNQNMNVNMNANTNQNLNVNMNITQKKIIEQGQNKNNTINNHNANVQYSQVDMSNTHNTRKTHNVQNNLQTNIQNNLQTNIQNNMQTNIQTNIQNNMQTNIQNNMQNNVQINKTNQRPKRYYNTQIVPIVQMCYLSEKKNISSQPPQNTINKNDNINYTNIQKNQEVNYEQIQKQNNLNNADTNINTINNTQEINSTTNINTKTIAYQKVKVYYKDQNGNVLYVQEELRPIQDESLNNNINNNYNDQINQINQNDYNTSNIQISEDKKYKLIYQENRDIPGVNNYQNQNYINDTYNNQCYTEKDIYGNQIQNNNINQQVNNNYQRTNIHMQNNNVNNNNVDELPVIPENQKRKRPVYKIPPGQKRSISQGKSLDFIHKYYDEDFILEEDNEDDKLSNDENKKKKKNVKTLFRNVINIKRMFLDKDDKIENKKSEENISSQNEVKKENIQINENNNENNNLIIENNQEMQNVNRISGMGFSLEKIEANELPNIYKSQIISQQPVTFDINSYESKIEKNINIENNNNININNNSNNNAATAIDESQKSSVINSQNDNLKIYDNCPTPTGDSQIQDESQISNNSNMKNIDLKNKDINLTILENTSIKDSTPYNIDLNVDIDTSGDNLKINEIQEKNNNNQEITNSQNIQNYLYEDNNNENNNSVSSSLRTIELQRSTLEKIRQAEESNSIKNPAEFSDKNRNSNFSIQENKNNTKNFVINSNRGSELDSMISFDISNNVSTNPSFLPFNNNINNNDMRKNISQFKDNDINPYASKDSISEKYNLEKAYKEIGILPLEEENNPNAKNNENEENNVKQNQSYKDVNLEVSQSIADSNIYENVGDDEKQKNENNEKNENDKDEKLVMLDDVLKGEK